MFGFTAKRRPAGRVKKKQNQVRLNYDRLESREMPAALSFVAPDAVYAEVSSAGSATSTAVRSLVNSNSGNMASRSSGASNAVVALSDYSGASSYKTVDIQTSAHGQNTSYATQALAKSTVGNGSYDYLTVQVLATGTERSGDRVSVTVNPSFVSTISPNNQGGASNTYAFYVNGGALMSGTDTSRGYTETFAKSYSFTTTVGSTFQIAFLNKAYVGASNAIGNVAEMKMHLELSVTGQSGGSSGGGGGTTGGTQVTAPAAPGTPTWSSAGGNDINLTWRGSNGASNYLIQYWNSSTGNWVNLTTVGSSQTSIRVLYGYGYYFRVGAANSAGVNWSNYTLAGF